MQHTMRPGSTAPAPSTRRWLAAALAGAALALGAAAPAAAQGGEVAGTVVARATSRPLAGATVTIAGQQRRAVTDQQGRFRITGVAGSQVDVRANLLGFGDASQSVRVGDTGVRLALSEAAVALNAVVVTGTPGGTERRALGNAVSTIDAAHVVEQAPINNVQGLLNGRAPGVIIQPASGAVGSGARIRVRGASSFSLSNEPLIYVDGVRIDNEAATGPANQAFGSSSISRLNDINPDEIASIEVLKGPAAATLYGTEASNGVIQIITKKGAAGDAHWNLSVRQGVNYLRDPEHLFPTNYQVVGTDTVSLNIVQLEDQRGHPIFRNGALQNYDLNVSGGTDRVRYYVSGGYENSDGAEKSNDTRRYTTRVNLNIAPSSSIDIGTSLGYIDGLTHLSAEAGFGGRVYTTVLADPRNLSDPIRRGFNSGTPEGYDELYHFSQGINRFIGSVQVNHRPTAWFTQRLSFGVDRTREDNTTFFPRIDSLAANPTYGSDALGLKELINRDIRYSTVDYSATLTHDMTPALRSSTSVGGQYYKTAADSVYAYGEVFAAQGLSSIAATTGLRRDDQDFVETRSLGFFGQEQVGWHERLFLTAGLRADDNSAFGRDFNRVYYPKFSASWVVSEEPFWRVAPVNTLKLRAAYGESGKQPQTFAAVRTYAPVSGPGNTPAVTPQYIGNDALGPELGKELELGFDAGFLHDRLGLELTYYHKNTKDAILQREIAPSIGFSGFQYFNAGEVRNSGLELQARARALERSDLGLEFTFNLATNHNEVVSLGDPNLSFVTAGTFLRHQVGFPIGSYFEKRVVSAQLDAKGNATNVMCDNGGGGSMLCTGPDLKYGTSDDAPPVFLGRSLPKVEGSLSSSLSFLGRFRLYGLVDFKTGFKKIDGNTRVRCTFFGGRCRENFYPLEFDPRRIAAIQSSRNLVDFLVDDASFAKLREVSVTYSVPDQWARRMGARSASLNIAGRNLHTWTRYGGLEPEAMFLGGSRGGNFSEWEQTTLPQLSQWVATINVGF
jgi:TonB-linked SusC/RagA family outer membrane protein